MSCCGVPTIVTDIEPEVDEEGNLVDGPLKVEFQRLLLQRKDTRNISIKNISGVPAAWKLFNVSEDDGFNCERELSIQPVEGTLQPGQSQKIQIGFHAIEKMILDKPVILEWIDTDRQLPEPKSLTFNIVAESYEIEFDIAFPTEYEGLDFGIFKQAEGGEKILKITNYGKYELGYRFASIRPESSAIAKYIKVETVDKGEYQGKSTGVLKGGASAEIKVIFDSKLFSGKEEVDFMDNTDLRFFASELLTGEDIINFPIKICAKSVF